MANNHFPKNGAFIFVPLMMSTLPHWATFIERFENIIKTTPWKENNNENVKKAAVLGGGAQGVKTP